MSISKNNAIGFAAIHAFAVCILIACFNISTSFYQKNLPVHGDGCYDMPKLGYALRLSRVYPPLKAATTASANAHKMSALNFFLAGLLGRYLPFSMTSAVFLNGIWYILFSLSLYLLFLKMTSSAFYSVLLSIPPLCISPHLNGVYYGLTDLNLNLAGYTIGGSIICWVLLSDYFRRPYHSLIIGIFCAILALGRIFVFGLLIPCVLPIALIGLFRGSGIERRKTVAGILTAIITALCISGWWLLPRLGGILLYPADTYGNYGVFGHGTYASTARSWYTFLATFIIFSSVCPVLPLVFGWRLGSGLMQCKSVRDLPHRINWLHVWLGFSPLFIPRQS